nr:TIGR02677 family protein [Natronoglycomyces albus]
MSSPFAYLDAPDGELYRRVLAAFTYAKERFVVHLRPEDIAEFLAAEGRVPLETVESKLKQLDEWGNLRSDPDTGRVVTVEDFYRARKLYQLTAEGEAAARAVQLYEREIGRRGELQTVALEDIRVRIRNLRELGGETNPDPAKIHNLLLELFGRLDSLASNAQAFMNSLQRTVDLHDVDESAFLAYKDRLIDYLQRFVSQLANKSHDIAGTLKTFDEEIAHRLLTIAAEREAYDAAFDESADAVAERLAEWEHRWSGLATWFGPATDRHNQANLLRQRARKAIPDLLETVGILQERKTGHSDRTADFLQLARWFATAPDDATAHRLWQVAFGLSTARHMTGEVVDAEPRTPWGEAETVDIAPQLRATGTYTKRGRPRKIEDRTAARAKLAEKAAKEAAELQSAQRRLATGEPVKLSDLGQLDRLEFRLLLDLLGNALAARRPGRDGRIHTTTSDGMLGIVLEPVPGGAIAEITTTDGVMYAPEHLITVIDRTGRHHD